MWFKHYKYVQDTVSAGNLIFNSITNLNAQLLDAARSFDQQYWFTNGVSQCKPVGGSDTDGWTGSPVAGWRYRIHEYGKLIRCVVKMCWYNERGQLTRRHKVLQQFCGRQALSTMTKHTCTFTHTHISSLRVSTRSVMSLLAWIHWCCQPVKSTVQLSVESLSVIGT